MNAFRGLMLLAFIEILSILVVIGILNLFGVSVAL